MKDNNILRELEEDLQKIAREGIKADRDNLKKDMCAQFSDPREWAREFVTNAWDAKATRCVIGGAESGKLQTIGIEDNGTGMNKTGIVDFFTLYRSAKDVDPSRVIGRHGIGKLSPGAIPGQCGFKVISSTGTECWQAETGSLLDDQPLIIQGVTPVPEAGTRFYVTFKKSVSLKEELEKIALILHRYVRFLPLDILIAIPETDDPESKTHIRVIHDEWGSPNFGTSCGIQIDDKHYNVILMLGESDHELYQNHVFVTNKYNLLCHDLSEKFTLPFLKVMVESPHFELPFGRHCLSNEDILPQLAHKIREELLPSFYSKLLTYYEAGSQEEFRIPTIQFESLTCHLIINIRATDRPWYQLPIFRLVNGQCLSFNELLQDIKVKGVVYIEDETNAGIDYSAIEASVLKRNQSREILEMVAALFGVRCQSLSSDSIIIEAPLSRHDEFSEAELTFEKNLGFHPGVIEPDGTFESDTFQEPAPEEPQNIAQTKLESFIKSGLNKEAEEAGMELSDIRWSVNHLLQRDGKTACSTHRYLYRDGKVVLNLYHPEIHALVELSKSNPALAGHWAISICLSDEQNILPHISAESRDDLLLLDAMAKAGSKGLKYNSCSVPREKINRSLRDFLRHSDKSNLSLN